MFGRRFPSRSHIESIAAGSVSGFHPLRIDARPSKPPSKDFTSSVEASRNYAIHYVKGNTIQGYLAYCGGKVVGWCNANTRALCLKCYCRRRCMGFVPVEESTPDTTVKSVFCFAIAPEMRRMGVAKLLPERVRRDALRDGFDSVEAYSKKEFISEAEDFMGPAELYRRSGFAVHYETDQQFVMRKQLK